MSPRESFFDLRMRLGPARFTELYENADKSYNETSVPAKLNANPSQRGFYLAGVECVLRTSYIAEQLSAETNAMHQNSSEINLPTGTLDGLSMILSRDSVNHTATQNPADLARV